MKQILITANKVTESDVERSIIKEKYIKLGEKICVCHMTLADGWELIGKAGVVKPEMYNQEVGEIIARNNAMYKVWAHLGAVLQDRIAGGFIG